MGYKFLSSVEKQFIITLIYWLISLSMKVYQDTKMPFCKSQMVNFIKYTYCWFEWMQNLSVFVQMILSEIKMNR